MISKDRLENLGWTVGAVVVGLALYDIIGRSILSKIFGSRQAT